MIRFYQKFVETENLLQFFLIETIFFNWIILILKH